MSARRPRELLVVALHEKCAAARETTGNPLVDEVRQVLVGMGWSPNEAQAAVIDLPVGPDLTIEVLLRAMPR